MIGYRAIYINWKKENSSDIYIQHDNFITNRILNLYPPEYYFNLMSLNNRKRRKKDVDLFMKSYFALSYFYYETNYRWVHRGVDDNIVNIKMIDEYVDKLERKYDPLNEPIIIGNCIKYPNSIYLQGGSGFLYSRKAVEKMLPFYEEVIKNCNKPEDVFHNVFLKNLDINFLNATSENFLGHNFELLDYLRIIFGKNMFLSNCKNLSSQSISGCKSFHSPIKNILCFHQQTNVFFSVYLSKFIFNSDESIHFFMDSIEGKPKLCKS